MRACSSGVSLGSSRSGSSDGSPTGSDPSGSSRAARWPCVRCALTSAIAAATPPSSCASTAALRRRGRPDRRRRPTGPLAVARPRGSFSSSRAIPGWRRDERGIAALEERAPLRRHRFGVLEVLVEQGARVAGVQPVDVVRAHPCVVPGAVRATRFGLRPQPGSGSVQRVVREDLQRGADDEADADHREREADQPLAARGS